MLMACVDMFNSEHQNGRCAPMSPRISFSSDFIDAQQMIKYERSSRSEAAASSDFEFSVTNYDMMAADELFFKGRLLPFKVDNCSNQLQKMTLRDELLNHGDDDDDDQGDTISTVSSRPPKSSSSGSRRWKDFLGMKRTAHINVSKKAHDHHHHGSMGKGSSSALPNHGHGDDQEHVNSQSSQERLTEGGSSCGNVEIGV